MPASSAAAPGPLAMLLPFAIMFLIFYFLVFQPQSKARRQHETMLKNLKKHDEVVTTGGLIGTVVNIKPDTVTLRVDENVRVNVERSAISRLYKPSTQASTPAPSPEPSR
jgi:preprotein translocase subunit YajC